MADDETPNGTDAERSAKNFTPADRIRQRRDQQAQHIANLRAQIADQALTFGRALAIIAQVAPARLAEFNMTPDDVGDIAAPDEPEAEIAEPAAAPPRPAFEKPTPVIDPAALAAMVEEALARRLGAAPNTARKPARRPASTAQRTKKAHGRGGRKPKQKKGKR
ncbi:MAG: hypothetical protein WDM81_13760 [Rhizomicrobium sp.]